MGTLTHAVIRVDAMPGGPPAHATIDALTIVTGGGQIMLPPSDASTAGHAVRIAASGVACAIICRGADRLFGETPRGWSMLAHPPNTPTICLVADGTGGWW